MEKRLLWIPATEIESVENLNKERDGEFNEVGKVFLRIRSEQRREEKRE